jgi:hypothetical protein
MKIVARYLAITSLAVIYASSSDGALAATIELENLTKGTLESVEIKPALGISHIFQADKWEFNLVHPAPGQTYVVEGKVFAPDPFATNHVWHIEVALDTNGAHGPLSDPSKWQIFRADRIDLDKAFTVGFRFAPVDWGHYAFLTSVSCHPECPPESTLNSVATNSVVTYSLFAKATVTPIPGTIWMLLTALGGLGAAGYRRQRLGPGSHKAEQIARA